MRQPQALRRHLGAGRVDRSLQRGEVLALLGANGAGKSTAIALHLGVLIGVTVLFFVLARRRIAA